MNAYQFSYFSNKDSYSSLTEGSDMKNLLYVASWDWFDSYFSTTCFNLFISLIRERFFNCSCNQHRVHHLWSACLIDLLFSINKQIFGIWVLFHFGIKESNNHEKLRFSSDFVKWIIIIKLFIDSWWKTNFKTKQ